MAKKAMVQRDKKRRKIAEKHAEKRAALKSVVKNSDLPMSERFEAQLKLSSMPRDGSKVKQRNRCGVTGRPRGFYRKLGVSRIVLRDLASFGMIPGLRKSSW